jgi:hypothetical protein
MSAPSLRPLNISRPRLPASMASKPAVVRLQTSTVNQRPLLIEEPGAPIYNIQGLQSGITFLDLPQVMPGTYGGLLMDMPSDVGGDVIFEERDLDLDIEMPAAESEDFMGDDEASPEADLNESAMRLTSYIKVVRGGQVITILESDLHIGDSMQEHVVVDPVARLEAARVAVESLVTGAIQVLDDGFGNTSVRSLAGMHLMNMMISAMEVYRPTAEITSKDWSLYITAVARNWVYPARDEGGYIDLSDWQQIERERGAVEQLAGRVAQKIKDLIAVGVSKTRLKKALISNAVEDVAALYADERFNVSIITATLKVTSGGEPLIDIAERFLKATEAVLNYIKNHPDPNVRAVKGQIASNVYKRGIQNSGKAIDLAKQVALAVQAARKHADEEAPSMSKTIGSGVAGLGALGAEKGLEFAQEVVAAYKAAQEYLITYIARTSIAVPPTILTSVTQKNIRGASDGESYIKEAIAAYVAALEYGENHPDKDVKAVAQTIALTVAVRGVTTLKSIKGVLLTEDARNERGRKAGLNSAKELAAASLAARRYVNEYRYADLSNIAPTVAVAVVQKVVKGKTAGLAYAKKTVKAYEAALKYAKAYPDKIIKGEAPTIAAAVARRGARGRAQGKEITSRIILASLAARKFANTHTDRYIRMVAKNIGARSIDFGVQGEENGISHAKAMIAACYAAREVLKNHPDFENMLPYLYNAIVAKGMRTIEKGRAAGEKVAKHYAGKPVEVDIKTDTLKAIFSL